MSLKEVILRQTEARTDHKSGPEAYTMCPIDLQNQSGMDPEESEKTIIVKRMDWIFNGKDC